MSFQKTLRYVQAARASTAVFGVAATVLYGFVLKARESTRNKLIMQLLANAEIDSVTLGTSNHVTWGSLSIVALSLSLIWNGLSFFDLTIRQHYRFGRRIYIFVDMIAAIALFTLGFLNFTYDSMLYYALDFATDEMYRLEMAAVVFLAACCVAHLAFFCYGCKDPGVANFNLEVDEAPVAGNTGDHKYASVLPSRMRSESARSMPGRMRSESMRSMISNRELEDVEMEKKSSMYDVVDNEVRVVVRR